MMDVLLEAVFIWCFASIVTCNVIGRLMSGDTKLPRPK